MANFRKLSNEELNRIDTNQYRQLSSGSKYSVILENVRSLNNVGSFFRTCDSFGVKKLYLCGITGKPPDREIRKTALGSEDSVAWEYHKDTITLLHTLKGNNVKLLAVEQTENSVSPISVWNKIEAENEIAIIFGNEMFGVEQATIDMCDEVIEIPQIGTKHSLNVAVSGGIVIWEIFKKLNPVG